MGYERAAVPGVEGEGRGGLVCGLLFVVCGLLFVVCG
jgi:hypothetical protein